MELIAKRPQSPRRHIRVVFRRIALIFIAKAVRKAQSTLRSLLNAEARAAGG